MTILTSLRPWLQQAQSNAAEPLVWRSMQHSPMQRSAAQHSTSQRGTAQHNTAHIKQQACKDAIAHGGAKLGPLQG